jgi:hypothetical protein
VGCDFKTVVKMEAVYTAEVLVPIYQSAGMYKPEEPIRIQPLFLRRSFVVCSAVYSHNLDIKVIDCEDGLRGQGLMAETH